jgi:hypothetical protein
MTSSNQVKAFILRDGEGNYYLLSEEAVRSAKISSDKAAVLQQEAGDTAGFFFNTNVFTNFAPQTNAANLSQNQNQNAQNFALGGFLAVGAQTAQNVGIQSGAINQGNLG